MPRNNKKFGLTLSLQVISLVLGLFSIVPLKVSAQSSPNIVGTIAPCINNSSSYHDSLSQSISGNIYARLPAGASPSAVYLYSEKLSDTSCQLIGAAKVFSSRWIFIGSSTSPINNIMLNGQGLSAQPHAAVVDLLSVPNSSICTPVVVCNINYQGDKGYLQPSLLSNTAGQIAVYEAKSITDVRFTGINYYADGSFLYSSTQLKPINRNYLPGGKHSIFIQVNFVNGEKININQVVNNGVDWSGGLRLRSNFYRSHNKFIFGGVLVCILIVMILILWLIRIIYKRHEFKIDHGIDEYEASDMINHSDDPDNNHPVVS